LLADNISYATSGVAYKECQDNLIQGCESMDITSGDKLLISAGGSPKTWVVSAINNHVVKYFDENNRYGQISIMHLQELIKNNQVEILRNPDSL